MSECPIGHICELTGCNPRMCNRLAHPWPVPYFYKPSWLPGVTLSVWIPEFSDDLPEYEHQLQSFHEISEDTAIIRQELWLNGWWSAIDLPYELHEDGGLRIKHHLTLSDALMSTYIGENRRAEGQFAPAVPINLYDEFYGASPLIDYKDDNFDEDGFFKSYWLDHSDFLFAFLEEKRQESKP